MTDDAERRAGGAWIGQHPGENTKQVGDPAGEDDVRRAGENR